MHFDERNQRWRLQVNRVIDGRRVRMSRLAPPGATETQALAIEQKMLSDVLVHASLAGSRDEWTEYVDRLAAKQGSWIDQALAKCRHRSSLRSGRSTLTRQALVSLLLASKGHCAITGLAFSQKRIPGIKVRPFFHSIDRIDSSGDYTADNVRIICVAANMAMMHWGEDVFFQMAIGIVLKRYGMCLPRLDSKGSDGKNLAHGAHTLG